MDANLDASLRELQTAIGEFQADGELSDDERTQLTALIDRVNELLEADAAADDHVDLVHQLEGTAVDFEGRHPTVAAVIRSTVQSLTNLGI